MVDQRTYTDPDPPTSQIAGPKQGDHRLVQQNPGSAAEGRTNSIHDVFREQARRTPERIAVVMPALTSEPAIELSYGELDRRSDRLAAALMQRGVEAGERVAVCMRRSPELIIALLGILKAGAGYLPVDPAYPAQRLAFMLTDGGVRVVLTDPELTQALPAHVAMVLELEAGWGAGAVETIAARAVPADALAYVVYTSGSTGTPKGVLVPHRGVLRLVLGADYTPVGPELVALQLAPITFDAATFEIWAPLLNGGRLVLFPGGSVPDPELLRAVVAGAGVTTLWLTASLFNTLLTVAPEALCTLREILTGGEALSVPHIRLALERLPSTELVNGYGPTETTTFATTQRIPRTLPADWESIPIGRPIGSTEVHVLDDQQRPVTAGETGELYIGGAGVALGYLNSSELTSQRFVPDPFGEAPGALLYRTGDRVRQRVDGSLEFVGRVDDQIKLNGFRIELGEIETTLRQHESVDDAVVVVREDVPGRKRLIGYVTTRAGRPLEPQRVLRFLGERLAEHMLPAAIVGLERIPLTENGKADRRALPAPPTTAPSPSDAGRPASDVERAIAEVWQEVLGRVDVGTRESFFDAGGSSLLAIRVVASLSAKLGSPVPLVKLFEHPTIEALARFITSGRNNPRVLATGTHARSNRSPDPLGEAIAVIGMAGRFPGAASVHAFWNNLLQGIDSTRHFRLDEIDPVDHELATLSDYVAARGVVDDAECFDNTFFGVSPREAEVTDPQHRVFLEVVHEALEDAGYDPARYGGSIGIYAGSGNDTYFNTHLCGRRDLIERAGELLTRLANEKDFLTSRISYKLDLRGPSVAINTACSTSLVAIAYAFQALRNGECDIALAGGVSIHTPQNTGYLALEGGMLSSDGVCRPFDADAQGTMFNNGAAVVVLKRLREAIADGDRIDAVLRGVGLNNDGSAKVSFTAPSVGGQAEAIARAQTSAGVEPETISYVEAHGTATPLGDPIEIEALTQVFRERTQARGFCAIGSLKGNVGHLVAASGVAGFIKTVLSLKHRRLPASLYFRAPNPALKLDESPFYVNAELATWDGRGAPLRAGVSSFGVGGTNAHAVLEEAPELEASGPSRPLQLLPISAKTQAALMASTARLAAHVREHPLESLADLSFTLLCGRGVFSERRFLVARDADEAVRALEDSPAHARRSASGVAFVFPGQGTQHVSMGGELYGTESVFREVLDELSELFCPVIGRDLRKVLYPEPGQESVAQGDLDRTLYTQPALFAVEYALAKLWQSWGVEPRALIGHSVGEFVAACLAGVFSLADAAALVGTRARLLMDLPAGAMLAVRFPVAELEPLLGPELDIAAVNAKNSAVASGTFEAIDALERELQARGVVTKRLQTSHAFHSPMVEPAVGEFERRVREVRLSPPRIPIASTVTADWLTPAQATDPAYWAQHLRSRVRFDEALSRLAELSGMALLEVGPRATCTALARRALGSERLAVASLADGSSEQSEYRALLRALGELWSAGLPVDWPAFFRAERRRRLALPTYPFERKRFFIDPPRTALAPKRIDAEPAPLPASTASASQNGQEKPNLMSKSRLTTLVGTVKTMVEESSGDDLAPEQTKASFLELGFDSLFLTQLSLALSEKFAVKLKLRQLMEECTSIELVAELLDRELPAETEAPVPADEPASFVALASPAVAAAGLEPSTSAAPPIGNGIESLIAQQLAIMSRQLEVLAAAGLSAARQPSLTVTSNAAPGSNGSAKRADRAPEPNNSEKPKAFGPMLNIQRAQGDELTREQRRHLDALIERYTARTRGSKRFTAQNRAQLADPRAASGFRPLFKEMVYPIVVERSSGARFWDVDGNEYVDLLNGFGSNFLGYSPAVVTEALKAQLDRGIEIGPQHPLVQDVAELMRELTGHDRVAFCNTGSEAVLGTMRLARTATGRKLIAIFAGAYHGIFDEVIVRGTKKLKSLPAAPGILPSAVENVLVVDYGTPESLEILKARAHELAGVLVEPVQSRRPELQPKEFLHELRALTTCAGAALIFDEVVTGFRIAPGGAQEYFGIDADLASYGKIVGGGLSIGVIAGKQTFMDGLDGGAWQYGDDSIPEVGVTYFAGTFVRHPLALAAAKAVLEHLKERGPELQKNVNETTERFTSELNAFFASVQAPLRIENFCSVMKVAYTADVPYGEILYYHLREKGVHVWDHRPAFLTVAHDASDLAFVRDAFKESVRELQAGGFLPQPIMNERATHPPVPGARLGKDPRGMPAWFVPDPARPGKYQRIELPS